MELNYSEELINGGWAYIPGKEEEAITYGPHIPHMQTFEDVLIKFPDEGYVDGIPDAIASDMIRDKRNYKLIKEVDPIATNILRWNDMTSEKQQEWADYRQALLDVPQQEGFPSSVTWPTKPST